MHLGGERHRESKVSCPRTQQNVPGQGGVAREYDRNNMDADLKGEFWLGLDKMHRLTKEGKNRLRVDLEDIKGNTDYAEYDMIAVARERAKYQLSLGTCIGERIKLN